MIQGQLSTKLKTQQRRYIKGTEEKLIVIKQKVIKFEDYEVIYPDATSSYFTKHYFGGVEKKVAKILVTLKIMC